MTTQSENQSGRALIKAARDSLHTKLLENDDYRALLALDGALDAFDRGASKHSSGQPLAKRHDVGRARSPRQSDVAYQLLDEGDAPLTIGALIELMAEKGSPVGGGDPRINLASVLSKDDRFESVRLDGRSYWWIAGRPVPRRMEPMGDLLGTSGAPIHVEKADD